MDVGTGKAVSFASVSILWSSTQQLNWNLIIRSFTLVTDWRIHTHNGLRDTKGSKRDIGKQCNIIQKDASQIFQKCQKTIKNVNNRPKIVFITAHCTNDTHVSIACCPFHAHAHTPPAADTSQTAADPTDIGNGHQIPCVVIIIPVSPFPSNSSLYVPMRRPVRYTHGFLIEVPTITRPWIR